MKLLSFLQGMQKHLLTSFFLLLFLSSFSQHRIALNSFGGFVIAHRTVLQNLVTGHTRGGEIAWEKTFNGSKPWHALYRNPAVGVSLLAIDLGNPKQLGVAYGITPYLRLPIGRGSDRFAFKFGLGLGILNRHYERVENHKNIAVGSSLNASIVLGFWYKFPLGKWAALQTGIQLQHFSNGSFRSPNLGINLPQLALGFQFGNQRNNSAGLNRADTSFRIDYRAKFFISPRLGVKELIPTGKQKFPIYNLHISRLKPLSPKYGYSLFLDFLYNSSLEEELAEKKIQLENPLEYAQLGLGAGMENSYGNFSIYLQMAAYVYSKQVDVGRFYHRLGVKHNIGQNGYLSFGLKSHFAKADYLELGWGIKL